MEVFVLLLTLVTALESMREIDVKDVRMSVAIFFYHPWKISFQCSILLTLLSQLYVSHLVPHMEGALSQTYVFVN